MKETPAAHRSLSILRSFARRREPVERCEFCGQILAEDHTHLLEPQSHSIVCTCDTCAIVASNASGTSYRRVPKRTRYLPEFRLGDAQWEGLMIPIDMAFFHVDGARGRVVAHYPSPAGATESLLDLEAWAGIVAENPILNTMEADVEALLVNRVSNQKTGTDSAGCYLVPIDECFRLVGLIRMHWRGLAGGKVAWTEIGSFFQTLKDKSVTDKSPVTGS